VRTENRTRLRKGNILRCYSRRWSDRHRLNTVEKVTLSSFIPSNQISSFFANTRRLIVLLSATSLLRRVVPVSAASGVTRVQQQESTPRGVVVRERGGTPFWQIFWSRGTALRQIDLSLATGGTLTLKRSGKSRRTR